MPRTFSFGLDRAGLEGVRLVVERDALPGNGDLESTFLDGVQDLERHPDDSQIAAVMTELADRGAAIIAVIRNSALVLDADLPGRLSDAIASLPAAGTWSVAGGGGLGLNDQRHHSLYASEAPAIPCSPGLRPTVDVMPDLFLVDAAFLNQTFRGEQNLPDIALETVLAIEGYLAGRVALVVPQLSAGIDGALRARDYARLADELTDRYAERLAGQTIRTLSGAFTLERPTGRTPAPQPSLDREIETAVAGMAPAFSVSIVVRTQFTRLHLLERLLSSISRARVPGIDLEVVLSSDADADLARTQIDRLCDLHRALSIRLQHNPPTRHSRVDNLVGGARAAMGDFVIFIDDDDYVDLFAFKNIRSACFGGRRPVIVTATELHAEEWQSTPSGRWILSASRPHARHPSRGWRDMFSGVNRLPVCALIIPRDRLIARLECHEIGHDLSEDYALFLMMMTDPSLPEIVEIPQTFCHVSIRGEENSVTMPDRRPWVRDIAAHLSDLTANPAIAGPGLWQLLATAPRDATTDQGTIRDLKRTVDLLRKEVDLVRRDNQRLRAESRQTLEAAR